VPAVSETPRIQSGPLQEPAKTDDDDFVAASTLQIARSSPPVFPVTARERGISGWVDLQFVVNTDGSVSDVFVTGAKPAGYFEQAAVDAVRNWRYKPILREGQAVRRRTRLHLRFALQD
jgi:protein TonB